MRDSIYKKLQILGPTAKYDTCGPKESEIDSFPGIYHAKTGNGICRLFKVLQSNSCIKNCKYCINQTCSNIQRVSLNPEEMASAFIEVYQKHLVDGLFLSSGITSNAETAMSKLLETTEIIRNKYHYKGYIHLKVMPGISNNYLEKTVELANRVSLNLEAPNGKRLAEIAPGKNFAVEVLDTTQRLNHKIKEIFNKKRKIVTQTSQFVVGATSEDDSEIIETMSYLYNELNLSRIFYSSFRPVINSPLEDVPASNPIREHRLYQTDWLMRFYNFTKDDIPLDKEGKLSLYKDPKLTWAEDHPEKFPIEINTASKEKLLKIPGIGPEGAKKIIQIRGKHGNFYDFRQLKKMEISLKRAYPFITVNGKYQKQLRLL